MLPDIVIYFLSWFAEGIWILFSQRRNKFWRWTWGLEAFHPWSSLTLGFLVCHHGGHYQSTFNFLAGGFVAKDIIWINWFPSLYFQKGYLFLQTKFHFSKLAPCQGSKNCCTEVHIDSSGIWQMCLPCEFVQPKLHRTVASSFLSKWCPRTLWMLQGATW